MERLPSFCLRSGVKEWKATVDEGKLLAVAEKHYLKKLKNPEVYLSEKLASSSSAQKIKELAADSGKVLIVCDDMTRPTPTEKILPVISEFLERGGVALNNQTVLFATGSHRPMSEDEAFKKIGTGLWGKIKWVNHDWNKKLAKIGRTPSGIPIEVNPILLEHRCIIGIGSVFPHRYCGWSGGGKIILPGVSGAETVSQTHWMPYHDASICLGNGSNMAIREIMSAAKSAGLSFLVQCICGGSGELNDIVIGEPWKAHNEAVQKAAMAMTVKVPVADVVIAQAWPEEADLWQACKALYAAENVVSRGGHIIIVASLNEGIGPHKIYAELMNSRLETILEYKDRRDSAGLAAAAAYVTYMVRRNASVSFVTDSPFFSEIKNITAFNLYKDLQEAINYLNMKHSGLTFSVLKEAPLILPVAAERSCN